MPLGFGMKLLGDKMGSLMGKYTSLQPCKFFQVQLKSISSEQKEQNLPQESPGRDSPVGPRQ